MCCEVSVIDRFQEIQLRALIFAAHAFRSREVQDGRTLRTEQRSLIARRQKPGAPIQRAAFYALIISNHDIAWQAAVLAAEAVGNPCAGAGKARTGNAGVDLIK